MTTWEEIRDEVAGMLADGQPLEDVITKLEKRKNEMAKANLLKAMDEMKNPLSQTNEEWFNTLTTEEQARFFSHEMRCEFCPNQEQCDSLGANCKVLWEMWLKQPHTPKE